MQKEHLIHDIIDLYQIIPQLNSDESYKIEKLNIFIKGVLKLGNNEISKNFENL